MKDKPKKKKRTAMYAAISVGVIIIAISIFLVYSSDQAKMRGQAFSKALEFLQEDFDETVSLKIRRLTRVVSTMTLNVIDS